MGYTEFDLALLNAWDRACVRAREDPTHLKKALARRAMATYARPLRSWSLVLRANDTRIEDNHSMGLVRMDGARIKALCSPVCIRYPGVALDVAARLFGVNRTTVSRWADPIDSDLSWWQTVQRQMREVSDMKWPPSTFCVVGRRLMLEHFHNRANPKRSETRVWTPGFYGLDPGGEVYAADWGSLRVGLTDKVDPGFVQQLQRVDRALGSAEEASAHGLGISSARSDPGAEAPSAKAPRARVWQWVCPRFEGGCGRRVYKLYLPMPYWTLVRLYGAGELAALMEREQAGASAFVCLRCAGLVYESAERASSPGVRKNGTRRRVSELDRAIKRMSGGVLTRRLVEEGG